MNRRDEHIERAVREAFRPPAFDEARGERVRETAARRAHPASGRHRRRPGGAISALAAAAAVLLVVALAHRGLLPAAAPTPAPGPGPASKQEEVVRDALPQFRSHGSSPSGGPTAGVGALPGRAPSYSMDRFKAAARHRVGASGWLSAQLAAAKSLPDPPDGYLLFTAEAVTTPTVAGDPLVVRVTLRKLWGSTARWERFGFTLALSPRDRRSGEFGAITAATGGAMRLRSLPGVDPSLTLRPGESTSALVILDAPDGEWRAVASYLGQPADRARTFTVIVPRTAP